MAKKLGKKKPSLSLEDRIKDVSEVQTGDTVLIHGRSGTGKTTLACSFPKPLLLLDIMDQGTDSVSDVKGVKVLEVTHFDDLDAVYWFLRENEGFKTVVLDTVTQLQDLAIQKVKEMRGVDPEAPMSKQMWGETSGLMKKVVYNFRDLAREHGINVVFIAQPRTIVEETYDEEGQIDPEVGPAVQPAVAKALGAAVKFIIYTYIREVVKQKKGKLKRKMEYRARLGPHPYYLTKVRSPKTSKVPDSIKSCTYEDLMKVKRGEWAGSGEEEE